MGRHVEVDRAHAHHQRVGLARLERPVAGEDDALVGVEPEDAACLKAALDAGANIVNNIMGTHLNIDLLKMVKNYDAAIVLMHIQGTPNTMQNNIHYTDLINDIMQALRESIEKCLEIGIKSDRMIVDPGIGFGKTVEHNLSILNQLNTFSHLDKPLLIGTSRKSFIGKVLTRDMDKRLVGTAATVTAGILRGAHIVRVHDVKAARDTVVMSDAVINESYSEPLL